MRHHLLVCRGPECECIVTKKGLNDHMRLHHNAKVNSLQGLASTIEASGFDIWERVDSHWSTIRTSIQAIQGVPVIHGFRCSICGLCYSTHSSLKKHQKSVHDAVDLLVQSELFTRQLVQSPNIRAKAVCFPVFVLANEIEERPSQVAITEFVSSLQSVLADDEASLAPTDACFTNQFLATVGWVKYFQGKDLVKIKAVVECQDDDEIYQNVFCTTRRFFDFCCSLIDDRCFPLLRKLASKTRYLH